MSAILFSELSVYSEFYAIKTPLSNVFIATYYLDNVITRARYMT
jgi:hypothetical protein